MLTWTGLKYSMNYRNHALLTWGFDYKWVVFVQLWGITGKSYEEETHIYESLIYTEDLKAKIAFTKFIFYKYHLIPEI